MGFMDKAKKLAEQAQQKLDEAQTQFNQNAAPQAPSQEDAAQYDEHGRPIQQPPPAGATPPPPAQPTAPAPDPVAPAPDPAAPPAGEEHTDEPPPPPAPSGGANTSPDPFKPLQ